MRNILWPSVAIVLTGASALAASNDPFEIFTSDINASMMRMHDGMAAAKPTGDPDRDFAAMMIPHHQGAVDMALIQLRFGKDERLRRLAEGIIVEQRQEIEVMQRILDELKTQPSIANPALGTPTHHHMDHAK